MTTPPLPRDQLTCRHTPSPRGPTPGALTRPAEGTRPQSRRCKHTPVHSPEAGRPALHSGSCSFCCSPAPSEGASRLVALVAKLPVDGEGVASRPLEICRARVSTGLSWARGLVLVCLPGRESWEVGLAPSQEMCRVRGLRRALREPPEGKLARIPSPCYPGPPQPRGRFPERPLQTQPRSTSLSSPLENGVPPGEVSLFGVPLVTSLPTCGGRWGRVGRLPLNHGGLLLSGVPDTSARRGEVYLTVIHRIRGEEFPLNCHRETAYFRCTVRTGLFAQKLELALKC